MSVEEEPSVMSAQTNTPASLVCFVFFAFCLVISVSHLCSPAHLLLVHCAFPHCSTAKVAIHLAPFALSVINCLNLSISCSNCSDKACMSSMSHTGSGWPGGEVTVLVNTSVPVRGADRVGGEKTIQGRGGRRGLEKETAPGRTSQQGQWDHLQLDYESTLTSHFIR